MNKAASFVPRRGHPTLLRGQKWITNSLGMKILSSDNNDHSGLILPSHPGFNIKSVMAPMVAASDYPFRYFLRKHCDVDLTFTQMLHCNKFLTDSSFRQGHLDLWEAGVKYPDLLPSQLACLGDLPAPTRDPSETESEAPLIVQLAGNNPEEVVAGANMILDHTNGKVSGLDLNCGCPQNIAKKGNYGAFLMERDFQRVCDILRALRRSMPESTAVSAKIRLPSDDATLKERLPRLMETGINFLTIHGRTIHENKTKVKGCHVDRIRLAIETAHERNPDFPVIANGGMEFYDDIQSILTETGAVAAMSSEALLETPNIFLEGSMGLNPRERLEKQLSFAKDYLNICANVMPPLPGVLGMKTNGSISVIRGHVFKFLYRYLDDQTDLRDRLAGDRSMKTIAQAQDIVAELESRYLHIPDEELLAYRSSSPEASWYRRHRKPDRRVHQKEVRVDSSLAPISERESIEMKKQKIRDRIKVMKEKRKTREAANSKRIVL
jgi:tRNA-dihydrouridine synthase